MLLKKRFIQYNRHKSLERAIKKEEISRAKMDEGDIDEEIMTIVVGILHELKNDQGKQKF